MKAYWLVAGAGLLAAVVGGVMWAMSNEQYGLILVLGGMVVAVMGLVMRLLQWGVDKSK
jgi:predicted lysophospholipase L1 biosynthesis ABC-type transport system permease subunit